jgi:hypothetical protein
MARIVEYDGVTHEFPDGTSDDEVRGALQSYEKRTIKSSPRGPSPVVESFPSIGGAVGEKLGGPVGAYVGGALGEIPRQAGRALRGESSVAPFTWDSLQNLNRAGNEQMASSMAGKGLGKAAGWAGRRALKSSIGQTLVSKLRWKGIDTTEEAVQRGLAPGSPLGRGGSPEVERRAASNATAGRPLLEQAEKSGVMVRDVDLARPQLTRAARRSGAPLAPREKVRIIRAVRAEANRLLSDAETGGVIPYNKRVFTPVETNVIRQAADQQVSAEHLRAAKSGFAPATMSLTKKLANGARSTLARRVPGFQQVQDEQRILMALRETFQRAENRRLPSAAGASIAAAMGGALSGGMDLPQRAGSVLLGAGAGALLGSPAFVGRSGLAMTNPAVQEVLRQVPRLGLYGRRLAGEYADQAEEPDYRNTR